MTLRIEVIGLPAPQGSKRYVGNGISIESSKNVKPWREAVKCAAREEMRYCLGVALHGPVEVRMTFTMPKPKSAPRTRKTYPDKRPDLSKLIRSTEDALTDAGVWEDDARIVHCIATKVFPGEGEDSLPIPGAIIRVGSILL